MASFPVAFGSSQCSQWKGGHVVEGGNAAQGSTPGSSTLEHLRAFGEKRESCEQEWVEASVGQGTVDRCILQQCTIGHR